MPMADVLRGAWSDLHACRVPFDRIELACEACDQRGRLRMARLIQEHGPDGGTGLA
jgi:hypothetical protein